ncbi:hypothetical protein J6590_039992 [Homalodisca vitripennis]|nr:hypothetical protein J6590_039992 [Homalodisca vitripennis]
MPCPPPCRRLRRGTASRPVRCCQSAVKVPLSVIAALSETCAVGFVAVSLPSPPLLPLLDTVNFPFIGSSASEKESNSYLVTQKRFCNMATIKFTLLVAWFASRQYVAEGGRPSCSGDYGQSLRLGLTVPRTPHIRVDIEK